MSCRNRAEWQLRRYPLCWMRRPAYWFASDHVLPHWRSTTAGITPPTAPGLLALECALMQAHSGGIHPRFYGRYVGPSSEFDTALPGGVGLRVINFRYLRALRFKGRP